MKSHLMFAVFAVFAVLPSASFSFDYPLYRGAYGK
jgi:hypothetical protein